MNILALDTCFGACSVAVGLDLLGPASRVHSAFEIMEMGHAERLVPMIAEVFDAAGIKVSEITRIAVTTGPGTFTGTRIGLAAARSLALACGAETVGVSSLAVMAQTARAAQGLPSFEGSVAIVVDARRDQFYFQLFEPAKFKAVTEARIVSLDEAVLSGGGRPVLFLGSGGEMAANAVRAGGGQAVAALPDLLPDARALLEIATNATASHEPLVPLYMRPPDAKPQIGKSLLRADA